jgi:signal transduction histidine kinase
VNKSGSRSEGGSGLGLAIVKHILKHIRENIYVEVNSVLDPNSHLPEKAVKLDKVII